MIGILYNFEQILDSWKRKETQIEKSLHKTNLEKHEICVNEKKLKMVGNRGHISIMFS